MGTIASEAVDQDFGGKGAIEAILGPFVSLIQLIVSDFSSRGASSSSTVTGVEEKFGAYLFWFARGHIEVTEGA